MRAAVAGLTFNQRGWLPTRWTSTQLDDTDLGFLRS